MRAALLVVAVLLAGCTAPAHVDEASVPPSAAGDAQDAGSRPPAGDAHGNMSAAEHANATNGSAAPTAPAFPIQEHDEHITFYAEVGGVADTGNMKDGSWTVTIPPGAHNLTVVANITTGQPSFVVGGLVLMVHNGTAEQPGGMLAGSDGSNDFRVGPVAIPAGASTVCVMFHAAGDPAAAQGPLDAHLVATLT